MKGSRQARCFGRTAREINQRNRPRNKTHAEELSGGRFVVSLKERNVGRRKRNSLSNEEITSKNVSQRNEERQATGRSEN